MLCLRIYCFVMLAAMGYGCIGSLNKNPAPEELTRVEKGYHFNYGRKDILNMNIVLKNIPYGVTEYVVYYIADMTSSRISIETCEIKKGNVIKIKKGFGNSIVAIYIELREPIQRCYTEKIADGTQNNNLDYNSRVQVCLDAEPCQMEVDFKNKCQDTEVNIANYCKSKNAEEYICESPQLDLQPYTIHQWYQVFNNNSYIGGIPQIQGKKTQFQIILQKFDNNTDIFSSVKSAHVNLTTKKTKIRFKDIGEINNFMTLNYTSSKYVEFNCKNYISQTSYSQVGLIDKTENNITTLNTTMLEKKFTMIDNGTVLCCLNYLVKTETDDTQIIQRFVENKTLLIYDETSSFDDMDTNTKQLTKQSYIIQNKIFFIGVSVAGIALILIVLIATKKLCCKTPIPENTLELDTYSNPSRVLYAALDIHNNDNRPQNNRDESPYAQIIGVLKPPVGKLKK